MSSDLTVGAITIVSPPPVAPCPTAVEVEVVNVGSDPAPLPIEVCLLVSASSDGPVTNQYIASTRRGEVELAKNASVTVPFMVAFPCNQAWLRAVADCLSRVAGNARTNPSKTVSVSAVGAAPWLATEVRLGLRDSMGGTAWNPTEVCPGMTLVVEAKIHNAGCASAPASVTEMQLTDAVSGAVLASATRVTPAVPDGATVTVTFLTTLTSAPPVSPPLSVKATVTADSTGAVTGQCDRLRLVRSVSKPVRQAATGSAPKVSFSVDGPIVPGQAPSVTWSIVNGCADLGAVRATIRFSGSVIYTSQVFAVEPLASAGEQGAVIPKVADPAIASGLNLIGTHTLDLTVDAFGNDPGPYLASATLTVVPDAVGPSWWTWAAPTATASWKAPFTVLGRLVNRGVASFTPVAISIRERPGPGPSTGVLTPADTFSTSLLDPGLSLASVGLGLVVKSWTWTSGPDWSRSGPTSLPFVYTAEFDLNDEFGNAYPTTISGTRTITVAVSALKIGFQASANAEAILAAGLAAFAAVLAFVNPIAAASALEAAWAMWGLSIWDGGRAQDPPAPDFDYDERVELVVSQISVPAEAGETLVRLGEVTDLALRARAADEALQRIHRKLLGSWVDNAADALRAQADRYAEVLQVLVRAASLLRNIVDEAAEAVRQDGAFAPGQLEEAARRLRDNDVPAELRDAARQAELPEDGLPALVEAAAALESAPDLAGVIGALATAKRTIADETQAEAPAIIALAR